MEVLLEAKDIREDPISEGGVMGSALWIIIIDSGTRGSCFTRLLTFL